jgi:penicillin-binding protein 2
LYLHRPHRPDDLPPRLSTRRGLRVAVAGAVLVAVIAAIFLRLWYLQVLSGEHYRALANDNRIREVRVQAPRGAILDRAGRVLVDNRTVLQLVVRPAELRRDPAKRREELLALARLLELSPADLRAKLAPARGFSGYPVVVRQGLERPELFYLREHQADFPGVSVERGYTRRYRYGSLAAHALGIVGQVSPAQLKERRGRPLAPGDIIGQSGLEYSYDRFLRGRPGEARLQVDALGRLKGKLTSKPAVAGESLRLALDVGVQRAGEDALRSRGLPGAFVALDVRMGAVLGIGSYPAYDPGFYTKPHTPAEYEALERSPEAPLLNRADQGGYPTGSSIKPLIATAALEEGLITPDEIVDDPGSLVVGDAVFQNAGGAVNGPIDLGTALQVSSDVYFYKLGLEASAEGRRGELQDWLRRYGLGRRSGIDLSGEQPGLLPTPAWRNKLYRKGTNPYIDRPWTVGDNINLAVGQGDLMVTPLQLAVAYAALANGGKVIQPHLGEAIETASGEVIRRIRPRTERRLPISSLTRESILDGIHRAAMEPGGTSYSVFGGFPVAIAGKTGTAERGAGVEDQSWYGAIAPYEDPEIVVVATIERGGFGVDAAAPLAAEILSGYFRLDDRGEEGG